MENLEQIEAEKAQILKFLEKMKLKQLSLREYRELQLLLLKREASFCKSYPLSEIVLLEDKVMFISDTHSGNKRTENMRLFDVAYNNALQNDIKVVIHAGDLTEACPVEHDKKLEIVKEELLRAITHMPNEILTGLLLGNHDYSAIRTYPELIPHYFDTPKLFVLGMKQVLLEWQGAKILLSHPVSQLTVVPDGHSQSDITIEGHHHYYDFHPAFRQIDLPSTCNDALNVLVSSIFEQYHRKYCRLFVIGSKQEENILLFEVHSIELEKITNIQKTETIELNTQTKQLRLYK